ncbi:hypothetical protein HDF16_004612 [Granulicella aggregans]|uniref:Dolichyl-phosphate-mannose-protein mannosyltransferase n=1 Tax=Granulicella aggregans TaxID=474949 RepID=A0A7W8E5A6_9BACT|nr:hypothetical protein [Granulicella aggregans]MBB5059883.1 hypothetical protein [Granulicella aggregans]
MPEEAFEYSFSDRFLPIFGVAFYCLICGFLFGLIRHANGGIFTYALDDAYIHLALSDTIAHGTYGINLGEITSPSSSLLWPFLLAPFAGLSWFTYVPLMLNFLFGSAAAWLFGAFIVDLRRRQNSPASNLWSGLSIIALIFIGNLPGLTFIAMEHTLQVLVAAACAWGIVICLRGRRIPWWCIAAALLGPSIRYENLGITLALALALWSQRRRGAAVLLCGISVMPLIGFSVFLRRHGLPALPLSVLVKGHATAGQHQLHSAVALHLAELADNLKHPIVWIIILLFLIIVAGCFAEVKTERRLAIFGAAAAVALHILIGRFGWLNRYEVYLVVFATLVVLQLDWRRPRLAPVWYTAGLVICSILYVRGTLIIAPAAHSIYTQQFQTSRLTHALPALNVAVNDLGLVAYHHPRSQYVLDLAGLASADAALKPHTTAWMKDIVLRHQVGLVAIYPDWFPAVPSSWEKIGELCRGGFNPCVSYYATAVDNAQVRDSFINLTHALPPGVTFTLDGRPAISPDGSHPQVQTP